LKIYVGVTDDNWFHYLKEQKPDEVNFWQPNNARAFRALSEGELFLFKLHAPHNYIVGGGIFVKQVMLPVSLTWDSFGIKNGTTSYPEFIRRMWKYRNGEMDKAIDPIVSSLIITTPFFWEEEQWIPVPQSWSLNIVSGKIYDTETIEGRMLFDQISTRLSNNQQIGAELNKYGKPHIVTPRLGQGGFRVVVTEAYHKRCAITGEKTLPVLDAAHIKPFSENGPNAASNGLLLRQDIHTLFDRGYITITKDNIIEVSRRIKEDYGNGKEYYAYHGKELVNLPDRLIEKPSKEFLSWHNENVYVG